MVVVKVVVVHGAVAATEVVFYASEKLDKNADADFTSYLALRESKTTLRQPKTENQPFDSSNIVTTSKAARSV